MATPPSFIPGIGRLTTDRFAFQDHLQGQTPPGSPTSFRHTADQIDMNPALFPGMTTVQSSLASVASYITSQTSAGQGFITVGNGYDTYVNADGTFNYDPSIPSLDTVLNPILLAIVAYQASYTPVPAAYERIRDGGIIVIPAGTYTVKNTIQVPPGITILGEGFGTKIVNGTGLDLTQQSPGLSGTPAPVFKILPDPYRAADDGAVDTNLFIFMRETRICNLVLSDNFVEPTMLGDTNYRIAQNTSASTPLILQENGSNLFLDQVYAAGRTIDGYTSSLVELDTASPAPSGTILKVDNCFIDGFSVPFQWLSTGDTGTQVNRDFLSVANSKIRGYGYLNGDGSSGSNNTIILMNDNNANIIDNYIYGNSNAVTSLAYMLKHMVSSAPNYGARSKVVVQGNNIEINRSNNAVNSTFQALNFNNTNFGGSMENYCSPISYGNNFQNSFDIAIDGAAPLASLTSTSNTAISTLTIGNSTIASNGITLQPDGPSASVTIQPTDEINFTPVVNISPGGSSPNQGRVIIQGNDATNGVEVTSTGPVSLLGNPVELLAINGGTGAVVALADNFAVDATNAFLASTNGFALQPYSLGSFTPVTGALVVYPIQGTTATQQMVSGRYMKLMTTTSTSPTTFFTFPMANGTSAIIEIVYIGKRNNGSGNGAGNRIAFAADCSITGVIVTNGPTTWLYAPSTIFDDTPFTASTTTNLLSLIVTPLTANGLDWQFVIDVLYC